MAYYETYQWSWIVYLLAAVGMYYVVFKFTKFWRNLDVKNYTRMISAVILFTPASHAMDGIDSIAPAFIVMFGELLTNGVKAMFQGLVPILIASLIGAVLLTIQAFFQARKLQKAKS